MMYVFLSGIAGFFVFDAYRFRRYRDETGVRAMTLDYPIGVLVHAAVYVAAGVLAVAINWDVLQSCDNVEQFPNFSECMTGPLLRGFGLGLAGPAGLSRSRAARTAGQSDGSDFGELGARATAVDKAKAALNFVLMR